MTFTFPSPDQFRSTIEEREIKERETLTDDEQRLLLKTMSKLASSEKRIIRMKETSAFNLKSARNLLSTKGYDTRVEVAIEGDHHADSHEVLVLVIDLGKAT